MVKKIFRLVLRYFILVPLLLVTSNVANSSELRYLQYDGFQLIVDCEKRSVIQFSYTVGTDTGDLKRRTSFSKDSDFSTDCQQHSSKSYSDSREQFDRGHMVPANHLDSLKIGIYQSNYVTNILPQARNMNRGAWLRTEEIIECHREKGALHVYGGPLYNTDRSRDFFTESHGVRTPSAFWKVIVSENDHIAWIIPNISDAKRSKLNDYLVSIDRIENETGLRFQTIDKDEKVISATTSWEKIPGCDLSLLKSEFRRKENDA